MNYSPLSQSEIEALTSQGCSADNWCNISVSEGFDTKHITNVQFSGTIRIGAFNHQFSHTSGVKHHAGLHNALIHNCTIEDNVYINRINNHIANYHIGKNAFIENCNTISVDGETSFGNGTLVPVLDETGKRSVPIFNNMSSHIAYIIAFYRHDNSLTDSVLSHIADYSKQQTSNTGSIGENAVIRNCGSICNTNIGDNAQLIGATALNNGSINSTNDAATSIGEGVQCHNFIISSGSSVSEASLINNCFIGQGCEIGKHYSAVDSLFFANCQALHGEATAIFAAPYTVTHHKSTLLIGGMYSFFNAGSGTNQSNHMYKLGPIHQGITERGVKMSSDAYVMWPARIGAYSFVMGRHYSNADTSALPFSYLLEKDGKTSIMPAVNLATVGTARDSEKWPKRDKRKGTHHDFINFDLFNPYIVGKMQEGIKVLEELIEKKSTVYHNCHIHERMMKMGINTYRSAIDIFIGDKVIEHIGSKNLDEIGDFFKYNPIAETDKWIDLAGMIAPKSQIDNLLNGVFKANNCSDNALESFNTRLKEIHEQYNTNEWQWTLNLINNIHGEIAIENKLNNILSAWKKAKINLLRAQISDAEKEFISRATVGFGIDGDEETKQLDIENVRGKADGNSFIIDCQNKIAEVENTFKDVCKIAD